MGKSKSREAFAFAISQPNIAFLIGNGANLADPTKKSTSWQRLLVKLAKIRKIKLPRGFQGSLSLTEVADILRLADDSKNQLTNDLVNALSISAPKSTAIAEFAHRNNIPILTTNFDFNLANFASKAPLKARKVANNKPSKSIPIGWDTYRGLPTSEEFARNIPGLWHVHGSMDFKNSLKLTSAQYTVSTSKAHSLIHDHGLYANLKCDINSCFGCRECSWGGKTTWLDIFFHRNLVVIGFGFGQSETFLRSLLLERTKYLKHRYGNLKSVPKSHFVHTGETAMNSGQRFFFQNLGFEIIEFENHGDPFAQDFYQGMITK